MPASPASLLMTRPVDASQRFVASLQPALRGQLDITYAPLMKITMVPTAFDPKGARGVIFTSANGVTFASRATQIRLPIAHCVGQATAAAARTNGWTVGQVGRDADDLVHRLLHAAVSGPLVHLCGRHTRGSIAERLTKAGIPTIRQMIYDQALRDISEDTRASLLLKSRVIAPIFSPRSARHFVKQGLNLQELHLVALSEAVAEPLKAMTYSTLSVARHPSAESIATAIEKCIDQLSRVERHGGAQ